MFQKNSFIENFHALEGGASRFCRNFLSHRTQTKSFVKEPFCFPEIFWYRKKLWIRGGISRFSVKIFLSHSAEKFRKGILLFLRNFLVSKSFMDEKGVSRFSVENFLSHRAEKLRKGTLECFTDFGHQKMVNINRKNIWHDRDSNPEPTA